MRLETGRDSVLPINGKRIPIRIFAPRSIRGAYLHIHGGGWSLGSAAYQDQRLWSIAQDAGVAVVSVEYRLAPENPHPAGLEDCLDAATWLLESCPEEFGTDRVLVGGESAGAHLALLAVLALRDRGLLRGIYGVNLVAGIYDLSMTPSQRRWGSDALVLSTPLLEVMYDRLVPGLSDADRRAPTVSPLYADLTGLPPSLLTVGDADPLLDDSLFMASRLLAAGGETEIDVYPSGAHGFVAQDLLLARIAHERMTAWMRGRVATETTTDSAGAIPSRDTPDPPDRKGLELDVAD